MGYIEGSIRQYVTDASAGSPTPGGGSVSALVGALGLTMGCMAANFTIGKKKFRDVEPTVKGMLATLEGCREELLRLTDEDTRAYATVSTAYGMHKETEEEKRARSAAIQDALKIAMAPPLESLRQCRKAIEALAKLVDIANPNLISDVGVSALLAEAALGGAKLNVEINLSLLKGDRLVTEARDEINETASSCKALVRNIVSKVEKAILGS